MISSPSFTFRPASKAPERRVFLGTLGLAPTPHTIERKVHPDGHEGILHSLRKVQEYANAGMTHPVVRAWAIDRLKKAGNPRDNVGRARALLGAVRTEKIWVPDPVRTEMMQGAHLTLGGMFEGGDCDDLTIAYLAAYLAACSTVGTQGAVVGHSYGADREITHVLGAILDGSTWHYVEPSTDKIPFGESYSPTREVVLWVPGDGAVACDADRCLTGPSRKLPNDNSANFVGINGLGAGVGVGESNEETALQESGDTSIMGTPSSLNEETSRGIGAWVLGMMNHVVGTRDELLRSFDALQEVSNVDGNPLEGSGWSQEDTLKTRRIIIAGDHFAKCLSEILNGTRAFKFATGMSAYGWDKQEGDIEVKVTDGDVIVKGSPSLFVDGAPGMLGTPAAAPAAAAAAPAAAAPAVAVSVPIILLVTLAVGGTFVASVYAWSRLAQYQSLRAQEEARRRITELYAKCLQSSDCTPQQRELIGRAFGKAAEGLQPAGAAPVQGGTGAGSGYGWSWLAWPMLIGIGALAFISSSREYVRLSNRRRRISRRDAREKEEKRAASRQRYAPIRRVAGVDPQTNRQIAVIDDEDDGGLVNILRSF